VTAPKKTSNSQGTEKDLKREKKIWDQRSFQKKRKKNCEKEENVRQLGKRTTNGKKEKLGRGYKRGFARKMQEVASTNRRKC